MMVATITVKVLIFMVLNVYDFVGKVVVAMVECSALRNGDPDTLISSPSAKR